jgi:aspartate racemase
MKIIGLIGGMSWESSAEYYRIINELVKEKLGDTHSCRSIMYSVDFDDIDRLQHSGEWEKLTDIMVEAAMSLEKAGAELIVICTNTMHKMADDIEAKISIPLVHIADSVGEQLKLQNIKKVALLGTKFTMEQDFYKGRISRKFEVEVIVPDEADRKVVHNIIYGELVKGVITDNSRDKYKEVIGRLASEGAEGVILGCTEIPLLIKKGDSSIPIFDSMSIHANRAVELSLKEK